MIIDPALYERIQQKKAELDARRPLPLAVLQKLREQFAIELAYNSNAIEGNSLTLRETMLVITEGITIRGKPLREHFEAINHQKAFQLLEELVQQKVLVDEQAILRIHKLILAGIDDTYAGRYRDINVRITGAVKSPPRFEKVEREMARFADFLATNPDHLNPVELAALAHYRFVEIHPFTDGNGRTARLLMNLLLMRHGYPITLILKTDRKAYYDRLRQADMGNAAPFVHFIARAVERSLDLYLDAFRKGTGYLTLAEAAKGSPYSQEYLSLLSRRGLIEAVKIGRNWHITKEALRRYAVAQKTKKSGYSFPNK